MPACIPADLTEGLAQVMILTGHEGWMTVKLIASAHQQACVLYYRLTDNIGGFRLGSKEPSWSLAGRFLLTLMLDSSKTAPPHRALTDLKVPASSQKQVKSTVLLQPPSLNNRIPFDGESQ